VGREEIEVETRCGDRRACCALENQKRMGMEGRGRREGEREGMMLPPDGGLPA